MVSYKQIAVLVCILYNLGFSWSQSPVPLLIWSNDRSTSIKSGNVILGATLTEKELEDKYVSPLVKEASNNIVLFLFDKLSMDDFTKYSSISLGGKASIFEHIKSEFSSNNGLLIPAVQRSNSKNVLKYLKSQDFATKTELYSSDIDNWSKQMKHPKDGKSNLIILHMLSTGESDETSKQKTLSENDNMIGQLLKLYTESKEHYTAFLTSEQPSEDADAYFAEAVGGRHLLQSKGEKNGGKAYNVSGCIMLYAKDIALSVRNVTALFTNATADATSVCKLKNESSLDIQFRTSLPPKVSHFQIRMEFQLTGGKDWKCLKMEGKYSGTLNGTSLSDFTLNFDCSSLASPNLYSYACGKSSFVDKDTGLTLTFNRFQVQPFGVKNNRFNDAYDCVGFFTIPIFMGLFVAFLLITILLVGVLSMMSIQTMDRFDDPKGETIQVPHE